MSTGVSRAGEPELTEVADGVHAYVQPDGSWGYSNAGLVCAAEQSLLIDTLFDLDLTRRMLDRLGPLTGPAPIGTVVNTHANGDHCYGNQLVADAHIVASAASAREMDEVPPALLHALKGLDLGDDGDRFVAEAFGPFRFDDIEPTPPDETFSGSLELAVGDRVVTREEVGPAHTAGDVIAHLPGVVFTGDIVFHGGTPVIWAGPPSAWRAACRRIGELAPAVVVPGHGPVGDLAAVEAMDAYLAWLESEVPPRHEAGLSVPDIARDLDLGAFGDWSDRERIVVNVDAAIAALDPAHQRMDAVTAMVEMGRYRYRR